MSCRSLRSLAPLLAAAVATACEGALTSTAELDLGITSAIAEAEVAASLAGDVERADALRHGAAALRWGVRPSTIEVAIEGETVRYLALVVGVERTTPSGDRMLIRSLVAWTGRPPTAMLEVTSASDLGVFGPPATSADVATRPGGARGRWKNLLNHELWLATSGEAGLELVETGEACPKQPDNPALRCALAFWNVRLDGGFQQHGLLGPSGPTVPIAASANAVHGVVISAAP